MKEPKIDNHFGDPEVQEYIDFIVREALSARDKEWREKVKQLPIMSKKFINESNCFIDLDSDDVCFVEKESLYDLINSMK